jgi:uncharacterized protein
MDGSLIAAALAAALVASSPAVAQETKLVTQGPTGELAGLKLLPAKPASTEPVLIIPGSGPTDRDGDSPLGIKARPYKLLAEALAARGVPTVRIDKRGMFMSAGAGDPNAVTIPAYVEDVRAWTQKLKADGASCVWLLGHSEGGLVALAAAQDNPDICGLLLIAAPGRRLSDVLRAQLAANPANAPLMDDALGAIAALEAGQSVDVSSFHPALKPLFNPQVQGFLISAFAYDPAALLAAYDGPALIVDGAKDLQVLPVDGDRLAAARDGVSRVQVKDMNHVLKIVTANGAGANVAAYADPTLPVAPDLVDAVAGFVTR